MGICRINETDIVKIEICSINKVISNKAIVFNVPNATGDGWTVRDIETGTLMHISEGCTVTLLEQVYVGG